MLRAHFISVNRPLTIGCCVLTLITCAPSASADTIFFDNFNDGDAEDGMPVSWDPGRGTWDGSVGDYISTGPIPRVSLVTEHVLGDTSTRARVRVDGNIGASLGIRRPSPLANPLVGYAGQILPDGSNGRVAIVRVDGAPFPNILGGSAVPFNPVERDVMIQFDAFADKLSLWAWPVGESMPTDPQLVVFDDTYAEGAVGLVAARAGGDPSASATFRFIHVSDTHIADPPQATAETLRAGDADQDLDFDQLDLIQVQVAAKYLTGELATWGEGDWDGAPGSEPGDPPAGNGLFDQLDVIAALGAGTYLAGPYGAVQRNGKLDDGETSVIYHASSGEVVVEAPAGIELTSIKIDSSSGFFTGDTAQRLGGSFDNDADDNIFKATIGGSYGSLSFENVAEAGLADEFILGDLSVVGSLAGGGALGDVDLIYVPEPATALLLIFAVVVAALRFRRFTH